MPFILALLAAAGAAYFWYIRAQRAADIATELMDVATDVRNAARRFGFRRRANQHPVESIDDPKIAIGAMGIAFLEMDDLPTADARAATDIALRKHLNISAEEAEEVAILGHWLVEECNGAVQAFPRLAKKLRRMEHPPALETLMNVVQDITAATGGEPSRRQAEALQDLNHIFR
jgi:hypothetical protein